MYKWDIVSKLTDMVVKINTWTELSAAISFAGHVELVSIDIASSKENYNNWIYKKDLWLTNDKAMLQYEEVYNQLKGIYEGGINIHELL